MIDLSALEDQVDVATEVTTQRCAVRAEAIRLYVTAQ